MPYTGDCDVLGNPSFFGEDVPERTWDCMFMYVTTEREWIEIHRETMTFAQADAYIAAHYPSLNIQILVPEDFPPYGNEG